MANNAFGISVENLEEIQGKMRDAVSELRGPGVEGAVAFATLRLHRHMTGIVHVDTGRLKNSLYPQVRRDPLSGETVGRIFTNVLYAPYEEARGGGHAFMDRTRREDGPAALEQLRARILRAMNSAYGD